MCTFLLLFFAGIWQASDVKQVAYQWVESHSEEIRAVNHEIWTHPELALREYHSSQTLADYLDKHGFQIEKGVAGMPTAFVASWGSGSPVIGIFGEFDALPELSQQPHPERRPVMEGGAGHGCGHSLFGTASASAAIAAREAMMRSGINGTLRFYGTPAEESIGGKQYMLEAGLFDDVDIMLGWHASDTTGASFRFSKAIASVRFRFAGLPAHASTSPHLGRSALDAVELMNVGVNFMREHVKTDARIHYVITKGGGQPNVVPADAEVWYYIRANKHADVLAMYEWIVEIAKGAAMMSRTELSVEVVDDAHEQLPNRPLAEAMLENLRDIGPPQFSDEEKAFARKTQQPLDGNFEIALSETIQPLPEEPGQGLASTDVGNMSWNVPTGTLSVASYTYGAPGHSWQIVACGGMSIGEKAILVAAKAIAATALDLFQNPDLIQEAWRDFQERKRDYDYRLLLPEERTPPVFPRPQ